MTTTSHEQSVLGIRFRPNGQVYYFTSNGLSPSLGDQVIVETDQGTGMGVVAYVGEEHPEQPQAEDLKPIERLASDEDLVALDENEALGKEAFAYCRGCIRERELDMKLVDVEVFFDRSKIIFYFTAPTRIDFRELVKDLVKNYRTRIELRQIGVRHETQMVGALGNCGMVCCCRRYLRKFAPVTIKMAKEQNLFLNPNKISGMCGRLLCCLNYEQANYEEFHRRCPKIGKKFYTTLGPVKVIRANLFRNALTLLMENNEEKEVGVEEWYELNPRRPDQMPPAELQAESGGAQTQPEAQPAPEQRREQRKKGRRDPRPDSRKDARGESRKDARGESRKDARGEPRKDSRSESRRDAKGEARSESKSERSGRPDAQRGRREQQGEARQERRKEPKPEPRKESRGNIFLPPPEELEEITRPQAGEDALEGKPVSQEQLAHMQGGQIQGGQTQGEQSQDGDNPPQRTGKSRRRRKRRPKAKS